MQNPIRALAIVFLGLLAGLALSSPSEARTHRGHHVSHANSHSSATHRTRSYHIASRDSGTSRGCLTSATRSLLDRIESRFGHVQIISTCRPGARIATTGKISKHASGQAVDFNAPSGRKQELVRWLIANHKSGGTMTYRDMGHIHVDVGYHFVSLGAASRG